MQAYPFVVRKVLRNSSSGSRMLLRDIVFDGNGKVKPARMSAILNAALGHVAEQTDGFVDFDAVPAEGAPLQVDTQLDTCQASHRLGILRHHTRLSFRLHMSTFDTSRSCLSCEKAYLCGSNAV